MYIKQLKIKNIRSISDFEMSFPNPAGWHVLIGDNGAGKSTIVRAVAAALIGPYEIPAARLVWKDWLKKGEEEGEINLKLKYDEIDQYDFVGSFKAMEYGIEDQSDSKSKFLFTKKNNEVRVDVEDDQKINKVWNTENSCFSAAYGPFRRFTGGDESKNVIFESSPKVGAHLSVFGEDVALTEALEWFKSLDEKEWRKKRSSNFKLIASFTTVMMRQSKETNEDDEKKFHRVLSHFMEGTKGVESLIENDEWDEQVEELFGIFKEFESSLSKEKSTLSYLKSFLNESNLLPHNTQFEGFDLDGNIIFKDGRGNTIPVVEMSDGYRSILSLLFDLIRQLIRVYGEDAVLANIKKGEMNIPVPGVVLIDEVDAHLHPTWQVRIGEWFTEYFPQIQFIVTTHSPLVCRAAKKGSIWQLAAPVNGGTHKEITGLEKERLIYGNILDAYGTELFGASPVRSAESDKKKARLGKLNTLFAMGKISKEEENERQELLKILSTDDPTGF